MSEGCIRIELTPAEKQGLLLHMKNLLSECGYYDVDMEENLIDSLEKRLQDPKVIDDFELSGHKVFYDYMKKYIEDVIREV